MAAPAQQVVTSAFVPSLAKIQGAANNEADPKASSISNDSARQLAPAVDAAGLKSSHDADHSGFTLDAFKASDDTGIWLLRRVGVHIFVNAVSLVI